MINRIKDRKKWIKELDKLWSAIIHERYKVCQYCGSTNRLNAHHIFTKGASGQGLRHDTKNGILLCGGHHIFYAHQRPIEFHEFLKKWMGIKEYEKLLMRSKLTCKNKDYKAWELLLTREIRLLKEA